MASLIAAPASETMASTPFERRLQAEYRLLADLAALNPHRLTGLAADDCTLRITLSATPARSLSGSIIDEHPVRLEYPSFFPALPLALYLEAPVFHPNIHPETGFVCLWDRHRAAHTAEDALHKTAAILGWRLFNTRPEHTMQAAAATLSPDGREQLIQTLQAPPLRGIRGHEVYPPVQTTPRRRRLS